MTIASEIQRIKANIANAYTSCNSKGATMPATQNSANLATTINSISSGTTPTGTLSITANGTYDVTNYASANVSVSGGGGSHLYTTFVANGSPFSINLSEGKIYADGYSVPVLICNYSSYMNETDVDSSISIAEQWGYKITDEFYEDTGVVVLYDFSTGIPLYLIISAEGMSFEVTSYS